MRFRSKALAGACAALSISTFASRPASADIFYQDQAQMNFTFTRQGQPVTCTVVGRSTFEFFPHDGSLWTGRTAMVDTDPACQAAVTRTSVQVLLIRNRVAQTRDTAHASGDSVETSGFTRDAKGATEVSGTHDVTFLCDEAASGCGFSFETAPK